MNRADTILDLFLKRLVVLFEPPHPIDTENGQRWAAEHIRLLARYYPEDDARFYLLVDKTADAIVDERVFPTFPAPAEVKTAAYEVAGKINRGVWQVDSNILRLVGEDDGN